AGSDRLEAADDAEGGGVEAVAVEAGGSAEVREVGPVGGFAGVDEPRVACSVDAEVDAVVVDFAGGDFGGGVEVRHVPDLHRVHGRYFVGGLGDDDAGPGRADVPGAARQVQSVDVFVADHGDAHVVAVDHADEAGAVQAGLPFRIGCGHVLTGNERPFQAHVFVEVGAFHTGAVHIVRPVLGFSGDLRSGQCGAGHGGGARDVHERVGEDVGAGVDSPGANLVGEGGRPCAVEGLV